MCGPEVRERSGCTYHRPAHRFCPSSRTPYRTASLSVCIFYPIDTETRRSSTCPVGLKQGGFVSGTLVSGSAFEKKGPKVVVRSMSVVCGVFRRNKRCAKCANSFGWEIVELILEVKVHEMHWQRWGFGFYLKDVCTNNYDKKKQLHKTDVTVKKKTAAHGKIRKLIKQTRIKTTHFNQLSGSADHQSYAFVDRVAMSRTCEKPISFRNTKVN